MNHPALVIVVEVAYALPQEQVVLAVRVASGSSVEGAIHASGLLKHYPAIDLSHNKVGRFGKLCRLDDIVQPGDRIEIYRPLQADPKEVRRRRALIKPIKAKPVPRRKTTHARP